MAVGLAHQHPQQWERNMLSPCVQTVLRLCMSAAIFSMTTTSYLKKVKSEEREEN